MSKEIAKKVLKGGVEVLVTVVSVTIDVIKEILKRKPGQKDMP